MLFTQSGSTSLLVDGYVIRATDFSNYCNAVLAANSTASFCLIHVMHINSLICK